MINIGCRVDLSILIDVMVYVPQRTTEFCIPIHKKEYLNFFNKVSILAIPIPNGGTIKALTSHFEFWV